MKYRVRMSQGNWWVKVFNADGQQIQAHGPFKDYGDAKDTAMRTGFKDWDK